MPGATSRLALPYPLSTDSPAGHTQMQNLANALDVTVVYLQGTIAGRPAASLAGRIYYATDNGIVYWDTGSAWVSLNLLADGSVTLAKLAADSVDASKIQANAVGSSEIAAGAVGTSELAAGAVGEDEIASALKPSGGASAATEALRALGLDAGEAAPGIHASQHNIDGADVIDWQGGVRSAQVASTRFRRTTNQSISTGTDTAITFDAVEANTREFSTTVPVSSIAIPRTGWYSVAAQAEFAGNSSGVRHVWVTVGGIIVVRRSQAPNGSSDITLNASGSFYATSGQAVQMIVRQSSGGNLNVQTQTEYSPMLGMAFMSA